MKKSQLLGAILAPGIAALLTIAQTALADDAVYIHRSSQGAVKQDARLWTIPPISRQWGIPHRSSHWTIPPISRQWGIPHRSSHWTIPRSAASLLPPGENGQSSGAHDGTSGR